MCMHVRDVCVSTSLHTHVCTYVYVEAKDSFRSCSSAVVYFLGDRPGTQRVSY